MAWNKKLCIRYQKLLFSTHIPLFLEMGFKGKNLLFTEKEVFPYSFQENRAMAWNKKLCIRYQKLLFFNPHTAFLRDRV